jgi:hypothetical protein
LASGNAKAAIVRAKPVIPVVLVVVVIAVTPFWALIQKS